MLGIWAYVHAACILSSYYQHRARQVTTFELAFGREYLQAMTFGEHVVLMSRQSGVTHGPQWLQGMWVGKAGESRRAAARRVHTVSSSVLFTNGCLIRSWPKSRKHSF